MAHVISQKPRNAPPYVLIMLVLLLLVSTVVAVLFYARYDKTLKQLAESQESLTAQLKKTGEQSKEITQLVRAITGREGNAKFALDDAISALTAQHAKAYVADGLASAIRSLSDKIGTDQTSGYLNGIAELKRQNDTLDANLKAAQTAYASLTKDRKDDQTKHEAELATLRATQNRLLADKDKALEDALAKQKESLDQKQAQLADLDRTSSGKDKELMQREAKIEELSQTVTKMRRDRGVDAGLSMTNQTDGKIVRLDADSGTCYINLGKNSQVTPGLTFAVYSARAGIPQDGKGKAKIIVKQVFADASECAVVESTRDDPIVDGDLVGNVVFNATRNYSFVVDGDFDLYGEGKPDPLSNRLVRNMIERMGGKVNDAVTIDTDFIVMGEEPARAGKPGNDAPASEWELYRQKLGKYDEWKNVQAAAATYQIPVLNTNRFLALTGMTLKRRTE